MNLSPDEPKEKRDSMSEDAAAAENGAGNSSAAISSTDSMVMSARGRRVTAVASPWWILSLRSFGEDDMAKRGRKSPALMVSFGSWCEKVWRGRFLGFYAAAAAAMYVLLLLLLLLLLASNDGPWFLCGSLPVKNK